MPYHPGHGQPDGRAVVVGSGASVHLVAEQHVVAQRFLHGQRAGEVLLDVLVADLLLAGTTAQNATSIALSFIPHSRSSGASDVPAQRQLPIAPVKPGAEPLPEHSIVAVSPASGGA